MTVIDFDGGVRFTMPALRGSARARRAVIRDVGTVDQAGFAMVYEAHVRQIHRYIARRVGTDLSEDLTADTFTAAFAAWSNFDPAVGDPLPWLYGIASHQVSRHRRRELAHYRALARHGPSTVMAVDQAAEVVGRVSSAQRGEVMASVLTSLPRLDRDILLLVAWAELSYQQVADALDIPVDRVRSRLHEARKVLRTKSTEDWS